MKMVKVIILLTVFAILGPQQTAAEFLSEGQRHLVDAHNKYRRLVGRTKFGMAQRQLFQVADMNKLSWDAELAMAALSHARCENLEMERQEFAVDYLGIPVQSMNTAVVGVNATISKILRLWFAEGRHYNEDFKMCNLGHSCDNYIQLVSAATTKVGCAMAHNCINSRNKRKNLLVCMYSPGANTGASLYTKGPTCSQCVPPNTFCNAGLCVACDTSKETCECRKTCGAPGVGYGWLNPETCTCTCIYGSGPNCDQACRNPDQYVGYDICAELLPEECDDPDPEVRRMLTEFCPETCSCRPYPSSMLMRLVNRSPAQPLDFE